MESRTMMKQHYRKFIMMVLASTALMFVLMYANVYEVGHVFFSQTRFWMALVMGGAMAALMLGFMWSMYPSRQAKLSILASSLLVFAVSLWLVRGQSTVGDVSYMRAMIPHHSIAILTSRRAHIKDPRVRKLADGIIEAQLREIAEMKALIADLEKRPTEPGAQDLPASHE